MAEEDSVEKTAEDHALLCEIDEEIVAAVARRKQLGGRWSKICMCELRQPLCGPQCAMCWIATECRYPMRDNNMLATEE